MSRGFVMLAAGGTAGHMFPAYALAHELTARDWDVELITDERGERYDLNFPAREVHHVPAATFDGQVSGRLLSTPIALARGVLAAWRILRRRRPAAIVGFGGYPTVPPMLAAALARLPRAVHEQNAVMGRANRLLAQHVTALVLSFDRTARIPARALSRARVTGNPVRAEVIAAARPYEAPMPYARLRVLVFGGSQGARFFADTVPEALGLLPADVKRRLVVTQQCRQEDLQRVLEAYEDTGIAAELGAFFPDLPARIAAAHLVISRSGASTAAELAVLGRPAILVPFPHALDNDQLENATRLAEAGGAWCIAQSELSPERLAVEIERLARDPDALTAAAAAARRQGRPDAVARLADLIEELAARA